MAQTARRVNRRPEATREASRQVRNRVEYYEDGSAVRKVYAFPQEEEYSQEQKQQASARVQKNRAREKAMSRGYVVFLALVCIFTSYLCVNFLQTKSKITTLNETIAEKESALNDLVADNDAYYNAAIASVTLEDVKDAALNRLGLHYAEEDQIRYYDTTENSYVRQYQSVPQ